MSSVSGPSVVPANPPVKTNKRLQLESVIREFQGKLGPDWDTYHEALSSFLVGRLSRAELVAQIGPLMKNGLLKYHNKLLLLNFANSLQDTSAEFSTELASFWNKRNAKTKSVKSNQYEKFKSNIMGLPLKERRRIRAITKDAGKRDKLSASITLTRQALLPKIPMIQEKEQQQLQVNNLVQWQQDVVNGINTPLATTSYELPDSDTLSRKVLMTSREHGLTGGGSSTNESSGSGTSALTGGPSSRRRQSASAASADDVDKKDVTISTEDMYNTLEMFPHLLEPGGPQIRLSSVMLQNDDLIDNNRCGYELPPKPASLREPSSPMPGLSVRPMAAAAAAETGTDVKPSTDSGLQKSGSNAHDNGDAAKENGHVQNGTKPIQPAKEPSHIGSVDELKWVLHDLISSPS
ncbi:hypothetical protein JCM33374_g1927 [Metschnikowia sp. JCM 33374]|nr:hypothetical protein JCM33374_g1927 [Metschnikowia sp. JCM 33374]